MPNREHVSSDLLSAGGKTDKGKDEADLKSVIQEQEMLWAAINKSEERMNEHEHMARHYEAQISHMRQIIRRYRAQIARAKMENLSLQHTLNNALLVKLSDYPV